MSFAFARLFSRQMNVQLRMRVLNLYSLLIFFIQPAVFSAVGLLLSRAAGNSAPDLIYTVIGGGIMGMWSGLVFSSTYDIRTDRREGTLELILGSPTSLRKVEGIRTFTNIMAGLVSLIAAVLVTLTIFDYSFTQVNFAGAILSLLVILFGFWCIGIFLANFLVWSRLSGSMVDYLEMPVAVFCGFMYPVSLLPGWMQGISTLFPMTWGLITMRSALTGAAIDQQMLTRWAIAVGISLLFFLAARVLDGKVHKLVRVTGEISSY